MNVKRSDSWTPEQDLLLVETVLRHIREGSTQLLAFDEGGEKLNRSTDACSFRWNGVLRPKYQEAILFAKKLRRDLKRKRKTEDNTVPEPNISEVKETITEPKDISEIKIKEYQGQRVVTFKDIDEVHGRPEGTAKRNFHQNKDRFIDGEDFFYFSGPLMEGVRKTYSLDSRINEIFFLTESGYLMLVKSFTDDLAWEVQRKLVKTYFKVKETVQGVPKLPTSFAEALRLAADLEEQNEKLKLQNEQKETEILMLEQQVADYEPKISYLDKILESKDTVIVSQIAEDYGLTAQALNKILHEEKVQYKLNGQWLLYSEHKGKRYTESKTNTFVKTNGETGTSLQTRWTQKGRLFIHDILTKLGIIPLMDR